MKSTSIDMLQNRFTRAGSILIAVSIVLGACLSSVAQESETEKQSVNPGINRNYLSPDLNPGDWVERFEKEGREVFDLRDAIVKATGVKEGMEVADIGSGTGLFTFLMAEKVGDAGKVYAVDIAKPFLMSIEARARKADIKAIQTVLCSQDSVDLPENSIDLAFICDVYHHFEFPESSVKSIRKALRPGGTLILVDFERVPGKSSDFILGHVRAGKEVFSKEIVDAGFQLEGEESLLKENYFRRFKSTKCDSAE